MPLVLSTTCLAFQHMRVVGGGGGSPDICDAADHVGMHAADHILKQAIATDRTTRMWPTATGKERCTTIVVCGTTVRQGTAP